VLGVNLPAGNSFIFLHVACPLSRRFSASSRGPRSLAVAVKGKRCNTTWPFGGCYGTPKMMIFMGNIYIYMWKKNIFSYYSITIPWFLENQSENLWRSGRIQSLILSKSNQLQQPIYLSKPVVSAQKWPHEATSTKPWSYESYIWSHFRDLVWPQTNDKPYQTCQHQPCQPISGHFNGEKNLLLISQHLRHFLTTNQKTYGGFLSHQGTPSHHPFFLLGFSMKPSSYF